MLPLGFDTHDCDHKGRCVHHPNTKLRKKKFFGGWKIVLRHCPECVIASMKADSQNSKKKRHVHKTRILKSNGSRGDHGNANESISTGTANTSSASSDDSSKSHHVVCGVEYVDPQTRSAGSYTGEVKLGTSIPDGLGTLRCNDGSITEGWWRKGELVKKKKTLGCSSISSTQEHDKYITRIKPVSTPSRQNKSSVSCNKQSNIMRVDSRQKLRTRHSRHSQQSSVQSSPDHYHCASSCGSVQSNRTSFSTKSGRSVQSMMDPPGIAAYSLPSQRDILVKSRRKRT